MIGPLQLVVIGFDDDKYAREELVAELSPLTSVFSRDDLLAKLEAVGVPAGPINTVADVFDDPQVRHRGLKLELISPQGDKIPSVRSPIRYSRSSVEMDRPSPRLGEHTAEILAELGHKPAE